MRNYKVKTMNKNFCVIMAGGIGARFWPLSRTSRPKQFLDILGTGKSFIRATYERFLPLVPKENFLVVTSQKYKELVKEHIPELQDSQILCEPLRRNTAPCVAYATYKISAMCQDANIVVTPADHLVVDTVEFCRIIQSGLDFVEGNDRLLTIGISPSRPETGYGYIQYYNTNESKGIYNVKTFTEKPNLELANAFLKSGDFLWNSGIFIWSSGAITRAYEQYLPQIATNFAKGQHIYGTDKEQSFIEELYPECENISIDYGIMEKASDVHVAHGNFGWSDIGTWGSLYQNTEHRDSHDNSVSGDKVLTYNTHKSIVSVPEGKVAIVEGLEGYLVVDKDDILLITRIENEQNIRNYVDDVKYRFGKDYV